MKRKKKKKYVKFSNFTFFFSFSFKIGLDTFNSTKKRFTRNICFHQFCVNSSPCSTHYILMCNQVHFSESWCLPVATSKILPVVSREQEHRLLHKSKFSQMNIFSVCLEIFTQPHQKYFKKQNLYLQTLLTHLSATHVVIQ